MGLILRDVSQSAQVVAMRAASSLRAGITTLLRRADLAPAVLIIAGISFLAPRRHEVGPGTRCPGIGDGPRPDGKRLNLHL